MSCKSWELDHEEDTPLKHNLPLLNSLNRSVVLFIPVSPRDLQAVLNLLSARDDLARKNNTNATATTTTTVES